MQRARAAFLAARLGLFGAVLAFAVFLYGAVPAFAFTPTITVTCAGSGGPALATYKVELSVRAAGPPTSRVILTPVNGGQPVVQTYPGQTFTVTGPYASIRVEATWPDAAWGIGEASGEACFQSTATPTATATKSATPTATSTATS